MRKLFGVILALVTLVSIVPACSSENVAQFPPSGEFIEAQLVEDAQTLNWIIAADGGASMRYARFMVDPLAVFDNEFNLHLRCMARDVEVSADGLVYTVTIRDDLKWEDGSRVTAGDYVFTLKNLMFADWVPYEGKAGWQEVVAGNIVFVSPEAVNDTTFKITRKTTDPDFVYQIYDLMPYPKYIATHYENDVDAFTSAPEFNNLNYSGNLGPYKPVAWSTREGFVVRRNADYYLGKTTGAPYFESYRIKQYGLESLLGEDLAAGKISFLNSLVPPQEVNSLKSYQNLDVYTVPSGYAVYLAYNQRDNGWKGLKDTRVRQAISMAIDKTAIINDVYLGFADPAFSVVPPYSPWYSETAIQKYGISPDSDKQKAIDLIKSAGYEMKEIDGDMHFVGEDGNPLKLIMPVVVDSEVQQGIAYIVGENLKKIGIQVEPKYQVQQFITREVFINKVLGSDQQPGYNNGPGAISNETWDMAIIATSSNALAIDKSQIIFASNGELNFFGFFNAEVDALYQRARSAEAVNPDARKKIYGDLAGVISAAQPVDFLVFFKDNYVFSRDVKGVEPGMNQLYNYQFWHFD